MSKLRIASGSPKFCWYCGRLFRRAPGNGEGNVYFNLISEKGTNFEKRVHGFPCTVETIKDGHKFLAPPK